MAAPSGLGQARQAAGPYQSPPLAQGWHPAWSLTPAAGWSRPRRPEAGKCPRPGGPPLATFPTLQRSLGMPKGSAGEARGLRPRLEVTVKLLTEALVKLLWLRPLLGSVDPREGDPAQLPLPSRCLWFSKTSTWWKVPPRGRQDPCGKTADATLPLGCICWANAGRTLAREALHPPPPMLAFGAPGYMPACSRLHVHLKAGPWAHLQSPQSVGCEHCSLFKDEKQRLRQACSGPACEPSHPVRTRLCLHCPARLCLHCPEHSPTVVVV